MKKISVSIDVSKLDKTRFREVEWKDKEGAEHKANYVDLDIVELKEPRFVKEGPTWVMKKTHFIKQKGKKGEEMPFVGDGFSFEYKSEEGGEDIFASF